MNIRIENTGKISLLYTPYNAEFVAAVKNIGGARWNREYRAWAIPTDAVEQAREIMRRVYGACDLPEHQPMVSIRLTFDSDVSELRAPITIFGKTIASAQGRDSGARTGEDVAFTQGSPQSGGSVKNWRTVIPAGCVVILHNVPQGALDMPLPDGVSAEMIEQEQSKTALLDEKDKLLARLAEIERLLKDQEGPI